VERRAAFAQQVDDRAGGRPPATAATSTPATGEYAPMPPVFGPASPSKIRL
jgi:hypothetical protein